MEKTFFSLLADRQGCHTHCTNRAAEIRVREGHPTLGFQVTEEEPVVGGGEFFPGIKCLYLTIFLGVPLLYFGKTAGCLRKNYTPSKFTHFLSPEILTFSTIYLYSIYHKPPEVLVLKSPFGSFFQEMSQKLGTRRPTLGI